MTEKTRRKEGERRETPTGRSRRRLRGWFSGTLLVLARIAVIVTLVAVWAHGILLNTDRYVATVGPILRQPQVTRAVSVYVADQTSEALDLQWRIQELPPPSPAVAQVVGAVAPSLEKTIRDGLTTGLDRLLQSDRAYNVWLGINRVKHRRLAAMLKGTSDVTPSRATRCGSTSCRSSP